MYIYKITNLINQKIYIGKSTKSVEESSDYFGSGKLINFSINKYGIENFKKEILEETTADKINEREIYWINEFGSMDIEIGYNLTVGGDGGDTSKFIDYTNPIMRQKQSEAGKGKNNSQYNKQYSKEELVKRKFIKYGVDNQNFGKTHSEEVKHKMSIKASGSNNSQYGKVWCVDEHATNKSKRKSFFKDSIPDGWITCYEFDDRKKDKTNSHYGRKWYNDGVKNYLKYPNDSMGLNKGRI